MRVNPCRGFVRLNRRRRWLTKTANMGYGTLDVPSNVKGMKRLSALHVDTIWPRSTEDTHPDRILTVRNVETLMGSGMAPMAQTSRPFPQGRQNPPGGQDGPRSERRSPKGAGKT